MAGTAVELRLKAGGDQPCALYRHWDAAGRLLYVGISRRVARRLGQHRSRSDWWDDVASMTIARFPSFAEAENAERIAIATESPVYNTIRRPPRAEPAFEPETPMPRIDIREDMTEAEIQAARDTAYMAGRARGIEFAQDDRRRERAAGIARAAAWFASATPTASAPEARP